MLQDHKELLVLLEIQVHRVLQDLKELLVQLVHRELLVLQVLQEVKVQLVLKVQQVQLDHRVLKEYKE